ncbi:MAG: glycosyltransferase [Oscillospiraceae bacterium]|nr:glycosyltransferase [Oscillospiraceae bacterium]
MKKIAFVTRVLASGGAEKVLGQIVNACAEQGMECLVITIWENRYSADFHPNVKVVELDQVGDGLKGKLQQYGQIRRLICEAGSELVLSMPEDIGIYVILALLGTGIPVVVSERNNPWVMPNKRITRILRRLAYPFAKGLIFQTERAASFFPKAQQKKGIVLPNPLACDRLPEVWNGQREKTVVSAGRLDAQKNFPLLIEAFAKFHETHPDYKLVIYGEGQQRETLEKLAAEKLPEGVWSMPGRVSDLPQRIARCSIFALSSDYEGVPNVLIEAMAVGTPAVSTDCAPGGAAALIENGKNGLIVPVGDAKSLAESLAYMADHPAEAVAMAEEAVKIRQRLDASKVTEQWLDYLKRFV